MTTKTIEYVEAVTREEEFDVCNGCGREVDDDGDYYTRQGPGRGLPLHFCSECLDEMADTGFTGGRASDWVEQAEDMDIPIRGNVETLHKFMKAALVANVGMLLLAFIASGVGEWWWGGIVNTTWIVLSIPLFVLLLAGTHIMVEQVERVEQA